MEIVRMSKPPKHNQSAKEDSPNGSMPGISHFLTDVIVSDKDVKTTLENYQILEELPRGGQAVVHKAIHTPTKTNVAIKVLLPSMLASARSRYHFEREVELIARLDHPNIVKIRDSGIIQGQYYFVMEYIQGEGLDQYVKLKKLSFRERVTLFKKICSAITYAHQQGIIHRDLKFANILVDEHGEPHILDFGLAKAIGLNENTGKNEVNTITGQWAGSLSNMSPEQAFGKPDLIDVRTDVYSLGIILYHLLTGQYPYDITGSVLQVLKNIQSAEPTRPKQIHRKFDSDMEAILLKAITKEADLRYQSTAEFQHDIECWLRGSPVVAKSDSSIYLLRKLISRHRYTSSVVVLLILIIFGFLCFAFQLFNKLEKNKDELQTVQTKLAELREKDVTSAEQEAFTLFLREWHDGRQRGAQAIAGFFMKNSREAIATRYLIDPRPMTDKEAELRKALEKSDSHFLEFIIAEHHLRDGNIKEALEAYQKCQEYCQQLGKDEWINKLSGTRLFALKAEIGQNKTSK